MEKLLIVALLGVCLFTTGYGQYGGEPKFQLVEEWKLWKGQHDKSYGSQLEELERHLVWLSNTKYIEQHNANSHIFGFTLAMNHFGDLVSNSNSSRQTLSLSMVPLTDRSRVL